MARSELLEQLKRALEEHRRLPAPRAGACDLQEADVDLFEEDAYVFGLAEAAFSGRRIGQQMIRLDKSIDERLATIEARGGSIRLIAEKFKVYRASVLRLAQLVSAVSGLPIKEWSRLDGKS